MNIVHVHALVLVVLLPLGCSQNLPDAARGSGEPGKQEPTSPPDTKAIGQLVPSVELNATDLADRRFYVIMHAGSWAGRSFSEIIQPHDVKRIIRVYDNGFTSGDSKDAQKRYDSLVSHLFRSEEKARDWGLLAEERHVATLVIVSKGGEAYMVEVLMSWGSQISAINVSGAGKGARIKVTGGPEITPSPLGQLQKKPFGHPPVTGHEY